MAMERAACNRNRKRGRARAEPLLARLRPLIFPGWILRGNSGFLALDLFRSCLLQCRLLPGVLASTDAAIRQRQVIMPRGIRRLHFHVSFEGRYGFREFSGGDEGNPEPKERIGKGGIELYCAR